MNSGRVSALFQVSIVAVVSLSAAALVATVSAAGSDPLEVETQPATLVSTAPADTTAPLSTATRDADDLSWHSIDGGGGTSGNGSLSLTGAIGQPESGLSGAGDQSLVGGLWASTQTSHIFSDGFESGNTIQWSNGS